MDACILAGNPKCKSHTLQFATELSEALSPVLGITSWTTIDLAEVAPHLFDSSHPGVNGVSVAVARSRLLITASPTYKASYTGLLKVFFDRYDANALAQVVAVPVMTGGSLAHALAPDVTLRPLLVELGASVPTRSLYLSMPQWDTRAVVVDAWLKQNLASLKAAVSPDAKDEPPL
jgi:FMN reductase